MHNAVTDSRHRAVTQYMYQKALCIREHHVYEDIWEVAVGETIFMVKHAVECVLEPGNFHDRNAVAVEME